MEESRVNGLRAFPEQGASERAGDPANIYLSVSLSLYIYINIYIYIHIRKYLSLSLSIYIYIYIYITRRAHKETLRAGCSRYALEN